MIGSDGCPRDLAALVVGRPDSLVDTGEVWQPWRLLDPDGASVAAVTSFFRDLSAAGRSAATQRSYGMALLRWFRFLWAVEVPWNEATQIDARDFSIWIRSCDKPSRREGAPEPRPNPVTGKVGPGRKYASSTRAHSETVLRSFYEFHRESGSGPMVNPFPLSRERRRDRRANAHHNPMEPNRRERSGQYRPALVPRTPRSIPDSSFDELFARLGSHRDRASVALWAPPAPARRSCWAASEATPTRDGS
ncbi:hypothetical protein [Rhodococcus opacus]|uniref:hypothetical protein n=1 Tax=Rhodococcus opacus TaxID=37919 RepID=UPI0018C87992|nr:hypothetical protein [Rhodococcus opacus]